MKYICQGGYSITLKPIDALLLAHTSNTSSIIINRTSLDRVSGWGWSTETKRPPPFAAGSCHE